MCYNGGNGGNCYLSKSYTNIELCTIQWETGISNNMSRRHYVSYQINITNFKTISNSPAKRFLNYTHRYNNKQYIFFLTYSTFSDIKQKKHNKILHLINGNKKINNLKLLHTNKGPAFFEKKIDDMCYIIDKYCPDIMCIAEANIHKNKMNFGNNFSEYNFELNQMSNISNFSRNAILVKRGHHIRGVLIWKIIKHVLYGLR